MDLRDISSKIQREAISVIQEEVPVEFDNIQQTPLGFRWRGNHYEVLEPLLVSKGAGGHLHYLLLTSGGVFCLSLVQAYWGKKGYCANSVRRKQSEYTNLAKKSSDVGRSLERSVECIATRLRR